MQDESKETTRSFSQRGSEAPVGRYRVLEKLGAGGMGEVYLATDTELHRTVALKFLPPDLCQDPDCRARFKREAQAAAKLNHPHIVTIYEVGELDGRPFIAMEYVRGRTLRNLVVDQSLSLDHAVEIAVQVCDGMRKAHQAGVIHRDIKPSNILIDQDGQAKIVDFGLASLGDTSGLTKSGTMVGTVNFMSPEQLRGDKVDFRTDIWSFGVMLYEIVSGRMPFRGERPQVTMYAIQNSDPEPMVAWGSSGTRGILELDRIVRKCLAKDREGRYHDADELLRELEACREMFRAFRSGTAAAEERRVPSIAVMPFRDMSPERDQEYFCEGIAEELINALTQVEGLKVAARTSTFQYQGKEIDVRRIGLELGVGAVLEGSVRKSGNRLRITAQLIQVSDGYHLWSERYDRDLEDIFAIQDEISMAIVHRLKVKLLKEEGAKLVRKHTASEQAYVLYLKGRYCWNRRYEGSLQTAVELFNQTISEDPGYAPGYIGLADSFAQFGVYAMADPRIIYPKAKAMLAKAFAIDDQIPEAHASAGYIQMFYDWDWAGANESYARALSLNPNCSVAHAWYSLLLGIMGRHEEGMREGHLALELEPLAPIYHAILGLGYYWLHQYDTAIERLQRTLEMDPNFPLAHLFYGLGLCTKGDWDQAISEFRKSSLLSTDSAISLGYIGYAAASAGRHDEARATLERLATLSTDRYVPSFYRGLVHYGLGEHDEAIRYLELAYEERESWMATINTFPLLDGLRPHPGFQALVRKIGFRNNNSPS